MKPPIKNLNLEYSPKGDMTQPFGVNAKLYSPLGLAGHNGIDLVRPHGTPMHAIEDGVVLSVKDDPSGFGKHLRIMSKKKNEKGYYHEWTYGHNHKNYVKVNDEVKAGQHICDMGNTGFVVSNNTGNGFWNVNPFAGTHLHLGLREIAIDPRGWSYEGSPHKLRVINRNNGFKGAIDPMPILKKIVDGGDDYADPRIPLMKQLVFLLQQKVRLLGGRPAV